MPRRPNFIQEIVQEVPVSVRHMIRGLAVAVTAGALFTSAAEAAPVLYGATGVTALDTTPASNLYTINPDTGATTSVGPIGKAVTGLAVDGTDGKLYGVTAGVQLDGSARELLSINPATGASTVIGSLGVNEIEDIAFSPLGQLYGWNETGDDLYRINKATGAIEKVGESGQGVTFGNGLSFDRNGALWGLLDGDFGHVFKIDPASGAVTTRRASVGLAEQDRQHDLQRRRRLRRPHDVRRRQRLRRRDEPRDDRPRDRRDHQQGRLADRAGRDRLGRLPAAAADHPGRHRARDAVAVARRAGHVRRVHPRRRQDRTPPTTANVISTAGDALLSVADPSSTATGHLVNGTFSLPRVPPGPRPQRRQPGTAFNNVGSSASPLNLLTYSGPISNDAVTIEFSQLVKANDPLRTGTYSKTLTYTLSTTTP